MLGKQPTIEKIQEVVSRYAEKFELSSVHLFGSYARGNPGLNSDIDLCVEGAGIG